MSRQDNLGAISTCQNGEEKYIYFNYVSQPRRRRRYVQYEWRDPTTGTLFSTIATTLEQCRAKREEWLKGVSCG